METYEIVKYAPVYANFGLVFASAIGSVGYLAFNVFKNRKKVNAENSNLEKIVESSN